MMKFCFGLFVGALVLAAADSAFAVGKCPDGGLCAGLGCGIQNCRCQKNTDTGLPECVDNVA